MSDSGPYSKKMAWYLLAFLTFLNILNFVDRQLIAALSPLMVEDLGLTDTQIGLLNGFFFVILYTFFGLVMGTFADRFNRPRLIAAGLFIWSLLTGATGLARNFMHVAAARLFVGVGEASLTPASMSMLSDTFPPERRALASGIYYMGIPLGAGMSLIVAGTLGPAYGWRACFYVLGLLGVVMSALLLLLRDPRRGGAEQDLATDDSGEDKKEESFAAIMHDLRVAVTRSPCLIYTIIGSSIIVFAVGAAILDQLWLVRERGFSQAQAAFTFGVIFLVGGTCGNFFGGYVSDWFHKRWSGGRLMFLAVIQLALIPFTFSYRFLTPVKPSEDILLAFMEIPDLQTGLFYLFGFIGSMAITMQYGPAFASVQDLVPAGIRSSVVALLIFGHNIFGTAPGNFLAGYTSDSFRASGMEQPMTWALLIVGHTGILAVPFFILAARRYQTDIDLLNKAENS